MESISKFIVVGGPVVVILLMFSLVAVAIIALKLWQLWSLRGSGAKSVAKALAHIEAGDRAQALLLAGDRRNPRADMIVRSLHLLEKHHLSAEEIREEITRAARSHINAQSSHLRVLEVIAVVAPLLGLLGTVLGIISAFQAMQAAGTRIDPAVLSGGIWEALLTTALGLSVAIPASLANSWFERRVETSANRITDDIGRIFSAHADHRATDGRKLATPHKA